MTFLRLVRAGLLASVLATSALVTVGAQAQRADAAPQAPAVGRDASAASVESFALTQLMPVFDKPMICSTWLPSGSSPFRGFPMLFAVSPTRPMNFMIPLGTLAIALAGSLTMFFAAASRAP